MSTILRTALNSTARGKRIQRPVFPPRIAIGVERHKSTRLMSSSENLPGSSEKFDKETYEKERAELDGKARQSMQTQAATIESVEEAAPGSVAGAWKWAIRKRVWDFMEENNIARMPRPVHHRIPNFDGADRAADRLAQLPEFQSAQCIKVNPDTPQKPVRFHVLNSGKTLLTPQPRLRTGFFSSLNKLSVPSQSSREACTSAGVQKFGSPLGLNADVKVDLVLVGSVAVHPVTGARIGKGEGFAELEYGILRWMGAISDKTLVITTIHDEQIAEDLPSDKLLEHDVPVDVIVTPTQVIWTTPTKEKPSGILWHKLSPEKLSQIRVLRELKARIEEEQGVTLPTGPSEQLPPVAKRGNRGGRGGRRGRGRGGRGRGAPTT
ncbi:hypothetical protein BSKO_04864 [Bryopsis sp. KO-2023]|nr:hypothetical protein BSKO_04864 [Bryopsis sp. KO-2023]